jgi:quinol monooxygenase YgiN
MPDPIVFVSHSRVKEGMLEAFREMSKEMFPILETSKPGTVLHYGYANEGGSELSFVHVFPDADAMDAHFEGAGDRAGSAMDYIETYQFVVYGKASEQAMAMLSQNPGVELAVYPDSFGGYLRLASASSGKR